MNNSSYSRALTRLCFPGPRQLRLDELPLAGSLQPHEVLLKCRYSLISAGTELAMYTKTHIGFTIPENTYARYPFYPGYAAVGTVEAVGSAVSRFVPGDLAYYPGSHQSYHLMSSEDAQLCPVPAHMPLQRVPFAAMVAIAYTSVYMSDARQGDTVVVLGLGLVGNLAAQLFHLQASSVIGVDLVGFRRQLANQSGIHLTVDAENQDMIETVRTLTSGLGPHTVVEATGNPALVSPALKMVRERGEVILLGSPRGIAEIDVYNDIHRKGVHLIGAHARMVPRQPESQPGVSRASTIVQFLHLLAQDHVRVEHLITDMALPSDVQAAYNALLTHKDETMAILIDWGATT